MNDDLHWDLFAPQRLARRDDPQTSHRAAAAVEDFGAGHDAKILAALRTAPHGLIKDEISARTGLSDIQVARRLSSMEERRLVFRRTTQEDFETRVNARGRKCCVWRAEGAR